MQVSFDVLQLVRVNDAFEYVEATPPIGFEDFWMNLIFIGVSNGAAVAEGESPLFTVPQIRPAWQPLRCRNPFLSQQSRSSAVSSITMLAQQVSPA